MPRRVRRQHTVSRFYLRGFATEADRIKRLELGTENAVHLTINDASVVKDFYSVRLPDGSISDVFEKQFSEIEGPASEALSKVLAGLHPIEGTERLALASWIALQHLRGEEIRASQTFMDGEIIRLVVGTAGKDALARHIENIAGEALSAEDLDREWSDLTKPGGPQMEPDVTEHMRVILDLWPGFTRYLCDGRWNVFDFARKFLVTSDHPVSLSVDPERDDAYGVGIGTADLFSIALSRKVGLTVQPPRVSGDGPDMTGIPEVRRGGTTAVANALNQATVAGSRRYVYLHADDDLDPRIRVPEPTLPTRMQMTNTEHLIREEGLFQGGSQSGPHLPRGSDDSRGFSLADLPWPIPRRKVPWA